MAIPITLGLVAVGVYALIIGHRHRSDDITMSGRVLIGMAAMAAIAILINKGI